MAAKKIKTGNGVKSKCMYPKCKNKPLAEGFCKKHQAANEASYNPNEHVDRITEMEAMTFRALDAEVRNMQLSISNLRLEIMQAQVQVEKAVAEHNQKQELRRLHIAEVEQQLLASRATYVQMIDGISSKRGLDPAYMTIDPEARTVRDLRSEKVGQAQAGSPPY